MLIVYVVIATLVSGSGGDLLPLGRALHLGLEELKTWLSAHNAAIMAAILLVIG